MGFLETIILGIVQGLTEFLPISSSGHLVFMQHFLGFSDVEVLFDIFLHIGTLGAIIFFFRKDLFKIILSLNKIHMWHKNAEAKIVYLIIIASIPTAIMGFLFKNYFEKIFNNVPLVACFLIITGILLFISERFKTADTKTTNAKNILDMNILDALTIGFMQGIAIVPGISRSGATISAGILRGLSREVAFRFSFLLSVPAILGALALEIKNYNKMVTKVNGVSLALGIVLAFVSGYFAIKVLFRVIRVHKLDLFSYYCWVVGLLILIKTLV